VNEFDEHGRRQRITVWYPELPPSANAIYFSGTRLTDAAREYKERFRQFLQQNYGHQLNEFVEPNEKYTDPESGKTRDLKTKDANLIFGITLVFYMDCLTTWGDATLSKSRRAKFRFAKTDLTNRIKFVEDCFKSVIDIDDSLTFESNEKKFHSPANQGVYIDYYAVPVETYWVPKI
jgi:hypothetical protein